MPLPTCLLPVQRPVVHLMGMGESEFYDLFVGDDPRETFDAPDIAVIDAFYDLTTDRSHALLEDWQHREATIDIVSCFSPIASDIPSLDVAITAVSGWLSGMGNRTSLRACGMRFQQAEALADVAADLLAEDGRIDGDPVENHRRAVAALMELAETMTLHLAFGDIWVTLALLADRVRVMVDLPDEGEIDMGGHHWDGDEDAGGRPVTPPLEMA